MGAFRQQCFVPSINDTFVVLDEELLCPISTSTDIEAVCGNPSAICSQRNPGTLVLNENPGNGYIGFDNIFLSFLTILCSMSLEGWVDTMKMAWTTKGYIAVPYFLLIVILGSLFAINLVSAVIYEAYMNNIADGSQTGYNSLPQELLDYDEENRRLADLRKEAGRVHYENPMRWCLDSPPPSKQGTNPLYYYYSLAREHCYALAENDTFGTFITTSIVVNTFFMSLEYHGASDEWNNMLSVANLFFTIEFSVEMVVKFIGYGVRNYFSDRYNAFDFLIVLFSWLEVSILSGGGYSSLRTFRLLRVLRTLKLAKSWHSLNQLILTVIRSIPGLANFGVILFLFLFIYSLIGMQFYGGKFTEENGFEDVPRANFDSLFIAFVTVFQVTSGENWNDVLYDCMKVNGATGAIYASSMFCFGHYIVLNLFLAILLDNFKQTSRKHLAEEDGGGVEESNFYDEMEKHNDALEGINSFFKILKLFLLPLWKALTCSRDKLKDTLKDVISTGSGDGSGESTSPTNGGAKIVDETDVEIEMTEKGKARRKSSSSSSPRKKSGELASAAVDKIYFNTFFYFSEDTAFSKTHPGLDMMTTGVKDRIKELEAKESRPQSRSFALSGTWSTSPSSNSVSSVRFSPSAAARNLPSLRAFDGPSKTRLRSKTTNTLDSAKHLALNDEELLEEFNIVKDLVEMIRLNVDIRLRRRKSKSFLDSFKGEDLSFFLVEEGVVKDQEEAKNMCQRMLEIGFIDLCEKNKSKKYSKKKNGSLPDQSEDVRGSELSEYSDVFLGSPKTHDEEEECGKSMFGFDVNFKFEPSNTLYRIGDITPSLVLVMSDQNNADLRKNKRMQTEKRVKTEEILRSGSVSLCMLKEDHPARALAANIVTTPAFERLILSLIAISSVLLALDEPHVKEDSDLGKFLFKADIAMTTLFIIEMSLKIVAMGFFLGKSAYLKNGWNVLDFVIVIVSVMGIILKGVVDLAFLKSLRAMRGLRPLRMVSRFPGMKMVVNAIFIALPACVNVLMVVMMCFLVFAIMGSTFFSGLFYYCNGDGDVDKYGLDKVDCHGTFMDENGENRTRIWDLYPSNFDNVGTAITTLFELSSLEMWPDIMNMGRDVTEVDKHPVVDASLGNSLFFVFFIFLGSFFVINLFVGVVINKFSEVKEANNGASLFLSDEQQKWVKMQKEIMKSKVKTPLKPMEGKIRRKAFYIVEDKRFDHLIMTIILLSIVTMACSYFDPQIENYDKTLEAFDYVWSSVFVIEMLLKMFGLGLKQYFRKHWNKFDFFIVMGSIVDFIVTNSVNQNEEDGGIDIKTFRVLRVARMVKLIKHNRGLANIFGALILSIPSLGNVGSILFLNIYVYAVMGMNLFAEVTVESGCGVHDCQMIDERSNFSTFGSSLLTLFRTVTGESWNGIMHDLKSAGFTVATPFFVSFVIMGSFIMLNLFVAVILENYVDAQNQDREAVASATLTKEFAKVWAELDPDKDYFIESFKLVYLLYNIDPPLGLRGMDHRVGRWSDELLLTVDKKERRNGSNGKEVPPETKLQKLKSRRADLAFTKRRSSLFRFKGKIHVIEYIRSVGIKRDEKGMCFYLDVLNALSKQAFQSHQKTTKMPSLLNQSTKGSSRDLVGSMDGKTKTVELKVDQLDAVNNELMSGMPEELRQKMSEMSSKTVLCDLTEEYNAASLIQCRYRGKKKRREFFNWCVKEGKWTRRLEHLFAVTLHCWTDEVNLCRHLSSVSFNNRGTFDDDGVFEEFKESAEEREVEENRKLRESIGSLSRGNSTKFNFHVGVMKFTETASSKSLQ